MPNRRVEAVFPGLTGTNYQLTSPEDPRYNCIAWAAGDDTRWWEPVRNVSGYYWPAGVPAIPTLANYELAYEAVGYVRCEDGALEAGVEKVALYVDPNGQPTHAARQLASGMWASKLGQSFDIEHVAPEDVGGSAYGEVALFMARAT